MSMAFRTRVASELPLDSRFRQRWFPKARTSGLCPGAANRFFSSPAHPLTKGNRIWFLDRSFLTILRERASFGRSALDLGVFLLHAPNRIFGSLPAIAGDFPCRAAICLEFRYRPP